MKLVPLFRNYLNQILGSWRRLQSNLLVNICGKTALIVSLVELGIILVFWRQLPPAVPLWFSRPWGEERLAYPLSLVILPISNLIFFVVNLSLAAYYTQEYPIFTRILFLTLLMVSLLSLLVLINILLLVI